MVLIKIDEEEKVQIQDQIQAQPCENIEVFNVPEKDVIFEVKQSANGMGMFALKDIPPGQIILREKPLIVMPDKVFSCEDSDYIEAWLDKRLNKMSSEDRQKFYDLSDCRSDKTTLGIFFTNDMNFVDDSAALFPTMARVNHACRPNADFITRKFLGVQDLVATKFIAQGTFIFQVFHIPLFQSKISLFSGQEIYISYLPAIAEGSQIRKIRQDYTEEWYGFRCQCFECLLPSKPSQFFCEKRQKISNLHAKGLENLESTELQNLIENLSIIDAKLPHQNLVCKIGFEKSLTENDWLKACQFFATAFLNESILNGEDFNAWHFVTNSDPVIIDNQIYLFPK